MNFGTEPKQKTRSPLQKGIEAANKRVAAIQAERDGALQKIKKLESHEAEIRKQLKDEADHRVKLASEQAAQRYKNDLIKQRQVLDADHDKALLKQQAQFNREREAYQKKTKELERKLETASAHERGEGAELDLFEELRDAFQGDVIRRIPKNEGGADISHKILYKGEPCGSIVYDSKNRQTWRESFVEKLRTDQISAGADHAVLATSFFPSGRKELHIEAGIIIASPARVVQIVVLLRDSLIKIHLRGLSTKEKASKMSRLYEYITSDTYTQRFHECERLSKEILELDVQEKKEHDNVWRKRGSLVTQFNRVHKDIDCEVSAILEGMHSKED